MQLVTNSNILIVGLGLMGGSYARALHRVGFHVNAIAHKQEDIDSFDEYNACMEVVAAYANSLPKWLLKGYSSNETNRLKVVLQSEEDPVREMIRKNPYMGLFVPSVMPDEPCPCGSGLSYRLCHGRNPN